VEIGDNGSHVRLLLSPTFQPYNWLRKE